VDTEQKMAAAPGGGKLLGSLLVEQGKLSENSIEKIVKFARKKRLRFGEAAVRLRLISAKDLEHAMASQFDYPFLEKGEGSLSKELNAAYQPFSKKGQALRNLCSQLMLRWYSHDQKTLAVAAADERQGCTYVAANIAVIFSQLGYRTLLIDADLQHGRQHKIFRIENKLGLSGVLIGRARADQAVRVLPMFRALAVMPAGANPPNPVEIVGRSELRATMSNLREKYDVVIVDTPPMSLHTGTEIIAKSCDSTLLVARQNHTLISDAKSLDIALHAAGARIVGMAMSRF